MPWSVEKPPSPPVGDDWSQDEVEACVAAANAVLADTGDEGEAIRACVAAAGRSAKGKGQSLGDQVAQVTDAWHRQQYSPGPMVAEAWVVDVYPDHIIVERPGEGYFKISYTMGDEGISFGDPEPVTLEKEYKAAQAMVALVTNDTIKALGDGRVGAYGIRWGSPEQKDLHREYFTPETDLGPLKGNGVAATVNHRIPVGKEPEVKALAKRILANPVKATVDAVGLFVEHVLDLADEYEAAIHKLVEAGKLKWSSGTASHLADADEDGRLTLWHIIEWAYTPQPAEPRLASIMPLKALVDLTYPAEPEDQSPGSEPGDSSGQGGDQQALGTNQTMRTSKGVSTMSEQTQGGQEPQTGQGDYVTLSPDQIRDIVAQVSESMGAVISPQVAKSILAQAAQPQGGQQPAQGKATHKLRDAQGTKSLGDFLISVVDRDDTRLKAVYGSEVVETIRSRRSKSRGKDLSGDTGAAGAYLIPPEYVPEILTVDPMEAIVRPRAHIQPMAGDTLKIPRLSVTAQPSAGSTYFFGGVLAYWTEEAEETTETEPGFKQMELRAHKLGGHTQITEELYDDEGVGLSALLRRLFGGAITWVEDYSMIRGTGGGQPLGILEADCLLTQARATADEFALEDAANMLGKFMPQSFGKGVWIMNITVLPQLIQLSDGTNVVWIPNAREGLPITLFGMPVLFTDKTPALGTEGDVILADWSYYVLGDRQRLAIAASEHYDFLKGLITVRFTHRVDGQPWLDGAVYIDDTNQISPFVALTDAS